MQTTNDYNTNGWETEIRRKYQHSYKGKNYTQEWKDYVMQSRTKKIERKKKTNEQTNAYICM